MNININDIKNGMTIIMDNNLYQIVEFQHVKPGKGSAFVRMKLRNLRTGSIKSFYEKASYIEVALCVNIVEDTSDHITIHKAKGAEYENVFVVGNKEFLDFLLNPNIEEKEEHRVYYVALSRAKKRLFLYLDNLKSYDEKIICDKYGIKIKRFGLE